MTFTNLNTSTLVAPTYATPIGLTAQAASIASSPVVSSAQIGTYRVTYYAVVTRAASSSSSILVTIAWTDAAAQTLASSSGTGNTVGTFIQGSLILKVPAVSDITYTTTYATSGATTMLYSLNIQVEQF